MLERVFSIVVHPSFLPVVQEVRLPRSFRSSVSTRKTSQVRSSRGQEIFVAQEFEVQEIVGPEGFSSTVSSN
jgi:hypothetical protein